MKNKVFLRAIHSLSHPLSVGAVLLVLFNDHFLRWHWPSWWTGKIGDFAWLVFAPFALVAILAWLVPSCNARREERVGRVAFVLTGIGFALIKTSHLCHAMAVRLLGSLAGWQVSLRRDPMDLLVLPALLVGWYVWKREDENPNPALSPRGWVVLALAAVATTATSPPDLDEGIACLVEQDEIIITYVRASPFGWDSADGGITWRQISRRNIPDECAWPKLEQEQTLIDPADPQIQYRFTRGVAVERSEDGGQTWRPEVSLTRDEALLEYYYQYRGRGVGVNGKPEDTVGPNDVLIHRLTGHVVVAMGHEGVLVRTVDGEWQLVPVGPYRQVNMNRVANVLTLLSANLWLVSILVLLTTATMARQVVKMKWKRKGALIVAWSLWVIVVIVFPPVFVYFVGDLIVALLMLLSALIAIPLGLKGALEIYRRLPKALIVIGTLAGSEVILFLLPYILWSQGTVPRWGTATRFALFLVGATVFAGDRYLKHTLNAVPALDGELDT